jgi:hypothetical protein
MAHYFFLQIYIACICKEDSTDGEFSVEFIYCSNILPSACYYFNISSLRVLNLRSISSTKSE